MTIRTEAGEQEAVIAFCELQGIIGVHIANEGKRSPRGGSMLKRMELRKGSPISSSPMRGADITGYSSN